MKETWDTTCGEPSDLEHLLESTGAEEATFSVKTARTEAITMTRAQFAKLVLRIRGERGCPLEMTVRQMLDSITTLKAQLIASGQSRRRR